MQKTEHAPTTERYKYYSTYSIYSDYNMTYTEDKPLKEPGLTQPSLGLTPDLIMDFNDKTTIQVNRNVRDALQDIARQKFLGNLNEAIKLLITEYENIHGSQNLLFGIHNVYPKWQISEHSDYVNKIPELVKTTKKVSLPSTAEIIQSSVKVRKSSAQIGANSYVDFSYNKYEKGNPEFTMNIAITGIVLDGKRVDTKAFMNEQNNPLLIYFKTIEKFIQLSCDPQFKLPEGSAKGRAFHLDYWMGVFSAYQLPAESFRKDVAEKLERFIHGQTVLF
jgi:hypothetical protein